MRRYKCATIKPWGEKHSLFRWSPFADIFQPLHMLDVAIIFSKCLASWQAARPMRSYQNNPSPSDPMESVRRHFPPPSLSKSVSLLRNEMRRVRWTLSTATRLRRIRWSPFADIFPPLWLLYFAIYISEVSRELTRRYTLATAARLHRIRWSLAVCLHVFPPRPRLYTLLYI